MKTKQQLDEILRQFELRQKEELEVFKANLYGFLEDDIVIDRVKYVEDLSEKIEDVFKIEDLFFDSRKELYASARACFNFLLYVKGFGYSELARMQGQHPTSVRHSVENLDNYKKYGIFKDEINEVLNLHNIHGQSRNSNSFQGGEDLKYYKGLIKRYGQEYADFCDSLRQSKAKHTKQDYIEAFKRAKAFRLDISKKDAVYDSQHRIELRNQGNQFIGLYELEYSQFKIK